MQEDETQLELPLEEGFQRLIAHGLVSPSLSLSLSLSVCAKEPITCQYCCAALLPLENLHLAGLSCLRVPPSHGRVFG